MKKWCYSLLFFLLISAPALAASDPGSITSTAVANKTDLSIAYLSSIFGTVSGVLTGTSGQMLGTMMLIFNQGILILAAFWLGFSVLSMVFKGVAHGTFTQKDNNVPLFFLRIAIGFGLLIPNPSTGYTLLQGIIMKIAVQGITLADQVWEYSLDYMKSGGALWSRPMQQNTNTIGKGGSAFSTNDMNTLLGSASTSAPTVNNNFSDGSLGMIQKVMAMEACMVQSSINSEQQSSSDDSVSNPASFSIYEDLEKFNFQFPGKGTGDHDCGQVFWNTLGNNTTPLSCNTDGSNDFSKCSYSHLALREIVFDLLPAVKLYVCSNSANSSASICNGLTDSSSSLSDTLSNAMLSALLNYKNLIDPAVRSDSITSYGSNALDFVGQAKTEGWLSAGRYYWDLLHVEGAYDMKMAQANYSNYVPNNYMAPNTSTIGSLDPKTPDLLLGATVGSTGYISQVNTLLGNFTTAAQSGATAGAFTSGMTAGLRSMTWLLALFMPIANEMTDLITAFSTNTYVFGLGPEPILWLHKIGVSCMSLGGNMWIGIAIMLFPVMLAGGVCGAVNSFGTATKAVMDWIQPVVIAAGVGFFAIGMMLAYYLPLLPYMMFMFRVVGWIIFLIEALVAAPLVAMGITQEGHDFLGRSTPAVMLAVNVFLQPVLMLIGLFAGMILCQVSLNMVLYTFSGFVNDIFYAGAPISGAPGGDILLQGVGRLMGNTFAEGGAKFFMALLLPLFVFPLFLGIFAMMVYIITTHCFSLIHVVPDNITQWIGGHQSHIHSHNLMDQAKGGISGVGHKLGESASRSTYDEPNKPKVNIGGGGAGRRGGAAG